MRFSYWVFAALFLPGSLRAQAILEHAAAATAGSVAGVAGKPVSQGIDKILGKVSQPLRKAAEPETITDTALRAEAAAMPAPGPGGSVLSPLATGAGRRPIPDSVPSVPAAFPVLVSMLPSGPLAPPPPELTSVQLAQVAPGTSREQVLSFLGKPSGSVSIPNDGEFVELYTYQSRTGTLGTVRLVNGAVSEVRLP